MTYRSLIQDATKEAVGLTILFGEEAITKYATSIPVLIEAFYCLLSMENMLDLEPLFICEPAKNTECNQKSCYLNSGPCRYTKDILKARLDHD